MKIERETLIRLHKQYSRDEAVQIMFKVIKRKDFEIGVLKSDVDELKHNIKVLNEKYKDTEVKPKTQTYKELEDKFNKRGSEIKKLCDKLQEYRELKQYVSEFKRYQENGYL